MPWSEGPRGASLADRCFLSLWFLRFANTRTSINTSLLIYIVRSLSLSSGHWKKTICSMIICDQPSPCHPSSLVLSPLPIIWQIPQSSSWISQNQPPPSCRLQKWALLDDENNPWTHNRWRVTSDENENVHGRQPTQSNKRTILASDRNRGGRGFIVEYFLLSILEKHKNTDDDGVVGEGYLRWEQSWPAIEAEGDAVLSLNIVYFGETQKYRRRWIWVPEAWMGGTNQTIFWVQMELLYPKGVASGYQANNNIVIPK